MQKRWLALVGAMGGVCVAIAAYAASPVVNETVAIVDPTTPSRQAIVTSAGALTVTTAAGTAIVGKVGIDQTTPGTTNGVNVAPSTTAGIAITPTVSAAAEGSHVMCAAACNSWGIYVTTGAAAGFLMTFNATSAPADGAVTPVECIQVAATSTAGISAGAGPPDRYSTGLTAVFSTTGCFTKTISATAFFKSRTS